MAKTKNELRTRIEERLHDREAVRRGSFRAVGDFAVVWVNRFEIFEQRVGDGDWEPVIENKKVKEKCLNFWRCNVAVGESIMGIPVEKIPNEWIEQEKEILGRS